MIVRTGWTGQANRQRFMMDAINNSNVTCPFRLILIPFSLGPDEIFSINCLLEFAHANTICTELPLLVLHFYFGKPSAHVCLLVLCSLEKYRKNLSIKYIMHYKFLAFIEVSV